MFGHFDNIYNCMASILQTFLYDTEFVWKENYNMWLTFILKNIPKNVVYIRVQRGILAIGAIKFNSQFGVMGMMRKTRSKYQSWSLFFCT